VNKKPNKNQRKKGEGNGGKRYRSFVRKLLLEKPGRHPLCQLHTQAMLPKKKGPKPVGSAQST